MREAIDYLNTWGKKFWVETEYKIKEITETLEKQLSSEVEAAIGVPKAKLGTSLKGVSGLTTEQKTELQNRGQQIVSQTQVQDLHRIVELLGSVLEDKQKQYYILIDGLDENWVEEKLRYKLIMSLILTARDFIQVKNAKVIIALRRDLIDRVFRLTRDSGFQEEKYQSLYLTLSWTNRELLEMLDLRVAELVSRRYTKQKVGYRDLLPKQYEQMNMPDLISSITTIPRDIIALFNACINTAVDQPRLTITRMRDALGEYSKSRLRAVADEWSADYSTLLDFAKILERRPQSFKISTIDDDDVESLCLTICSESPKSNCIIMQNAMNVVDCISSAYEFKVFLVKIFYRIGIIGLKLRPQDGTSWAEEVVRGISFAEIDKETSVVIHPKYHRALGIDGRNK